MPTFIRVLCAAVILHAAATTAYADDLSLLSYARLGQGVVFGPGPQRAPALGFGIRAETDHFAIDASFLNFVIGFHPVDEVRDMTAGSLLKIEGLRYFSPRASSSAYVGAGMSWGHVSLGRATPPGAGVTGWHGQGLQGELTAGYELARNGPLRVFVQADATAPIFRATSQTFVYPDPTVVVRGAQDTLYAPTVVVSLGVGWQRVR